MGAKSIQAVGEGFRVQSARHIELQFICAATGPFRQAGKRFVMKYVLIETDGKTKLEIIQEDNRPGAVQEEAQGEENPLLQALKALAEQSGSEM